MPQVNDFCIKNIKKKLRFKSIRFFAKLYPRVLSVTATPDPRVIFIILIITLNLHDPSLSGSDCNTRSNSLGCGSGCKVVS
jgi:hypothetical protein